MLEIFVVAFFTLAGVMTQRVIGFGSAALLMPALLIYFSAPVSVTVTLFVATAVCILLLYHDRAASEVHWPIVRRLGVAAVPGLVLGSYVVTHADKAVLQIIIGALVILSIVVQEYAFPKRVTPLRVSKGVYLSGFAAGILNASAAQAAPPLVLWMRSHITTPNQVRHNLSATFIFMNIFSIITIYLLKPSGLDSGGGAVFALLLPVVILGNLLGSRMATHIKAKQYQKVLFIAVITAGLVSIIMGVVGLK